MAHAQDLVGLRFGRLRVVSAAVPGARNERRWNCLCDCGQERIVFGCNLRRGASQSCGCLRTERSVAASQTHGRTRTSLYGVWTGIVQRCENPALRSYPRYGGRGIAVCERWRQSFEAFAADMGERPSPLHSIDRIVNDGPYSPDNCRWATMSEQAGNRANAVRVAYAGRTMTLTEWAHSMDISVKVLWKRLFVHRWPVDRALSQAPRGH